jgi:hypothetical protein
MGTDTYEVGVMIEKRLIELTQAVDALRRSIEAFDHKGGV